MTESIRKRIPKPLLKELDALGDDKWSAHMGGKHIHIHVQGRFVGIVPRDGADKGGRGMLNVRSQIRAAVKGRG